ncbi:MAG: hypothetical protein K2N23_07110 [Clostridia bacterium]|nr:hypothetical protein [Clostridia bacterium]
MSEKAIVEKIIADAENEARAIIADAEKKAEATIAAANARAERRIQGEKAAADKKAESILEGKAATARLDSAKIMLGEKRAVIDEVYARALNDMHKIGKAEALFLFERLLCEYAEEGDEVVFAEKFPYAQDVEKLSIVKERKLKVSSKKADIEGGCLLIGKNSDKNLSFSALLAADREENQASIAAKVFSV